MSDHLSSVWGSGSVHVSGSAVWFVYTIDNKCRLPAPPVSHSSLQQSLTFISELARVMVPPRLDSSLLRLKLYYRPVYRVYTSLLVIYYLSLCYRRDSTLYFRQIWQWIEQNSETLEIRTNYWAPASGFLPFKIPQISASSQFTIYSDVVV